MKTLHLIVILFVISNVSCQRRTTAKTDTAEVEQSRPAPRGRGRSRFAATQEFTQLNESPKSTSEPVSRRPNSSRKRVPDITERRTSKTSERAVKSTYEVDEVVNESPIDSFRRQSKPRVLTESHFESIHAPKKKLIDPVQAISEPPAPALEEIFKTADVSVDSTDVPGVSSAQPDTTNDLSDADDGADTTFKTNSLDITSETSKSNEITREFTKAPSSTTPRSSENRRSQNGGSSSRRSNGRSRGTSAEAPPESAAVLQTSRAGRTRTRPTRKPEEASTSVSQATSARAAHYNSRRRPETSTQQAESSKRSPSIFIAEETQEVSRIRPGNGRKASIPAPERINLDIPSTRSKDASRKRTATPSPVTTTTSLEDTRKRTSARFQSRRSESKPNSSRRSVEGFQSRHSDQTLSPSSRSRSRSKVAVPNLEEFTLPTVSSKGRFRARDFPPIIDEQKLEVLPLFETEPKTVRPITRSRSRSRTRSINNPQEAIQTSATENDLNFTLEPRDKPNFSVSRTQTVNVETRTETSVKRTTITRRPIVKESVIAEVSEVTSKRTVSRRKNSAVKTAAKTKADRPKASVSQVNVNSRGTKKSEVKLADVKKRDSGEEIDESDNYPEPFKALIQAKKNKKESRPTARPHSSMPTITSTVTTTTASTTSSTTPSTTTNKEDDILDNELVPKASTTSKPVSRPTRKRFSLTTKYPEVPSTTTTTRKPTFPSRKSSKVVRSTAQPTATVSATNEHRFHAKFSSTQMPPVKNDVHGKHVRGTPVPRGLYSSRKNTDEKAEIKEKVRKGYVESPVQSIQIPKSFSQKKSGRYSSKFRTDISGRGSATRSSTSAPAYIPTIPTPAYVPTVPTLAPPRTTVNSGAGSKDVDLGLEIISFDDPVNTVPSANLINEEFVSSSTENALNNPVSLVKDASTEKPVSIIERIINSITAMSTTTPPDTFKQTSTASTTESSSAILKLAPKKFTRHDKTKLDETPHTYPIGTVAFTTEKPTTIIERILSSLSAIQATDDTNSNQVGKDFNTISSPSTTPVSKATNSYTTSSIITLPAQISTSINPLSVLDEISPDQVLEKRTIGKLLTILNGLLYSTESPKLIVVTPKTSNFVTGVSPVKSSYSSSTTISSTTPMSSATTPPQLFSSTAASLITTTTSGTTIPSTPSPLSTTLAPDITTQQLFTSPKNLPIKSQVGITAIETNSIIESRIGQTGTTAEMQTTIPPSTLPSTQITSSEPTATEFTTQPVTPTSSDMVASTQTEATVANSVTSTMPNALPLSLENMITTSLSTDSTTSNTFPTTTEAGLTGSTDIETLVTYLSTIPTLQKFQVSPGSVSVYSANDLSNSITSDDFLSAVTIAGRSYFDVTATTDSTTTESGTTVTSTDSIGTTLMSEMATAAESSTVSSDGTTADSTINQTNGTESITVETTVQNTTPIGTTMQITTAASTTVTDSTTVADGTTTVQSTNISGENGTVSSGSVESSAQDSSIPSTNSSTTNVTTNNTSNQPSSNVSLANRSGRLLNIVQDPIQNSIDISTPSTTTSTTPDYFVFAVLNNNTILRKKPPTIPNKDTPYVIVGLYPNNTVVRKFPNGTLVPMERIIRVRGFDTRENPPPLPEITSNQVTNDLGSTQDNKNVQTVDQSTVPTVEANPLSLDRTTSGTSTTTSSSTSSTPSQSTTISSSTTDTITSQTKSGTTATNNAESSTVTERSLSSVDSTTVAQITNAATTTLSSTVPSVTTVPSTTLITTEESGSTLDPTLPTLSELLNGRTLEALNSILNVTSNTKSNTNYKTLQVSQIENSTESTTSAPTLTTEAGDTSMPTVVETVTPALTTQQTPQSEERQPLPLSNNVDDITTTTVASTVQVATSTQTTSTAKPMPSQTSSATQTTTTDTPSPRTTTIRLTSTPITTVSSTTEPVRVTTVPATYPTVTFFPTFPTFITTLFPNLLRGTTQPPITTTTEGSPTTSTESETIAISASTVQPTTVSAPIRGRTRFIETTTGVPTTTVRRIRTTTTPTTTTATTRRTTTTPSTTTVRITTTTTPTTTTTVPTTTTATTTTTTPTTTTTTEPITTTQATTTTTTTTRATTTTSYQTINPDVVSRRSIPFSVASSTVAPITVAAPSSTVTPKLKQLTEQQKKDLETLAQLEKEQAALLQQLSFLTSLNFGGNRNGRNKETNNLANRVIQLAVERGKTTTPKPTTTSTTVATTKTPVVNNIQDQLPPIQDASKGVKKSAPSIEDILKQYNLTGVDLAPPSSSAATYGKSNDAILAALLKQQGINPPTPKSLSEQIKQAGIFEETTTTRKPRPRPTTRPPGRLMQGLNWLLNALAPQPQTSTRRPKPVKPKKPPVEQELLANSPTRLTPVVTSAPRPNSLTQDDIQKLIKQLEAVQKDPKNTDALDFSQIKSLQNLINTNDGVQVASNGQHGASSRVTTEKTTTRRRQKSTTVEPSTVSNNLEDEEDEEEYEVTTVRSKPALPPLRLRPVPGVDDNSEPLIRGNLITAAVNVTRAISGFLGTALQGAAQSFQSLLGSGSRLAQASSSRPG